MDVAELLLWGSRWPQCTKECIDDYHCLAVVYLRLLFLKDSKNSLTKQFI
jgi:hypothetical protein